MIDEVKRIISVSANNKSLDFRIIKSLIIPDRVIGDEIQLKQILLNLLSNAVNYTERGEIILEVKYQAGKVIFIVRDTGIGIKKQKLETIFNAFEQIRTDEKKITYGTGLGLSIVKRILDVMKGEIEVNSRINKGSTFQVTIPLPTATGESKIPEKQSFETNPITDLSSINILVAEDNAINQKLIKSILKKVNNICDIAENGKIALEKLKSKKYDIILLDMQMPVMDGMETLSHLRQSQEFKNLPVIALTAFAMSEERDKYIAAGCNEFVAKPVNKNELYAKIHRLCN
jgi:CheY-like chemotaxis protein/anti-sigma regulatory factor (Ser/Thr protein kinase)